MNIDKIMRRFKIIYSLIFSVICYYIVKIKRNRVVCWSYSFNKYSCNPRYIAEFLVNNYENEFEVIWIQNKKTDTTNLDKRIKLIYPGTLSYFWVINSAHILIYNSRTSILKDYWIKKKNQIYIMTWHATMGLKRVEREVEHVLSSYYVKSAKRDSKNCDLILSGCNYYTNIFKKSFWYDGEILEKGNPRNDIFFRDNSNLKTFIYSKYNIPNSAKILLYAPTFRNDNNLCYYEIDWNLILPALNEKFGGDFYILLKLHPNFVSQKNLDMSKIMVSDRIINVTDYPEMQELLCVADLLMTDYSSCMFDFGIVHKPCFLHAVDYKTYERGFVLNLVDLPFMFSENDVELLHNIQNFNIECYVKKIKKFNRDIGVVEEGNACSEFYRWLKVKIDSQKS